MFYRILIVSLCLSATTAFASLQDAQKIWQSSSGASSWRKIIIELVNSGYPFSAVPLMKDYLVQNRTALDAELDQVFEAMIVATGIRPFETLPDSVLGQSRSSVVRYILAKKHFRKARWSQALAEVKRVNSNHPVAPYATHLKAAIHSIQGKLTEAESDYKDCISFSRSRYNAESNPVKQKQLLVNRDLCVAGLARTAFNRKDFNKADFLYLDVPKSSPVWPEIIFEEAWSSYYLGNYNRSLGKLVSYKAPVFDFVFNPEIEILKSLSYLKLCLYSDVNKTVDEFYSTYMEPAKNLRRFILSHGKDYSYYFRLVTTFEQDRSAGNLLTQSILKSITKDSAWQEMKQAYIDAMLEFNRLKGAGNTRFSLSLMKNVKEVVSHYQTLLGSYAKSQFQEKYNSLSNALQDMSFIKLEVLARKKQSLYESKSFNGKRGDVKYIDRNDKQYFWDFNGEFWADELGDYVFALGSEC
jgi:tetratricopeptide (TPR) repeat protein